MAGWHHPMDISLSELRELVIDREAVLDRRHATIHEVAKSDGQEACCDSDK